MTEDPVVIAALITAAISPVVTISGILISHILTLRSNEKQRKAEAEERYFYEIHQRRLALYEEVIQTLAGMNKPTVEELLKMSIDELSNKALCDYHTLLILTNRLAIYGNSRTSDILAEAAMRLKEICKEPSEQSLPIQVLSGAASLSPEEFLITSFIRLISESLGKFSASVREETDPDFVNKKLNEIQKKITGKKQKKKHQQKSPAPIVNKES